MRVHAIVGPGVKRRPTRSGNGGHTSAGVVVRFTSEGLVHHSDAGSQYTAIAFTQALADAGIAPSIGTVGDELDNALMESTIGLYKTELIDRQPSWTSAAEVERETASWVQWFNTTTRPSGTSRPSSTSSSTVITVCGGRGGRTPR